MNTNRNLKVIYENGVLKPLEPVHLKEHQPYTLTLVEADERETQDNALWQNQRSELTALLQRLGEIPTTKPADKLSNRDHDRIVYSDER